MNTVGIIKWFDSCIQFGEYKRSDLERQQILTSCGWVVENDDKGVSLAMDTFDSDGEKFRTLLHIPKCNILSYDFKEVNQAE